MKQFFSLILALLFVNLLSAQVQSKVDISLRHLEEKHKELSLEKTDFKDMNLSFQATSPEGISYVYFHQTVDGIPIKNAILNFTLDQKGQVAFVANNFVSNKMAKVVKSNDKLDAQACLAKAAEALGVVGQRMPSISKRESNKITFDKANFASNNITATKQYDYIDDKLIPVWEYSIDMADNADYWEIRIDRNTGKMISKNNLTVYCTHDHGGLKNHDKCEISHHKNLMSKEASVEEILNAQSSYKVYALPAESPIHGPHKIFTDPFFTEVSPFGWHDTDGVAGNEYTITRGNNVNAFVDQDDNDAKDAETAQPDGGANLAFDFPHDKNKETIESINAVQTNLFYMTNMMHDITALYGFDEQWGNFQQKNYTNKGMGNDFVVAQAIDGFKATPRRINNANFATPPDGASGSMQMFLWTAPTGGVRIDAPSDIAGNIVEFGTAEFGNPIPSPTQPAIIGKCIVAVDESNTSNPKEACNKVTTDVSGKIAMIDRGICNFSQKTKNAEDKGAIAVIICNVAGISGGNGEEIINMGNGEILPKAIPSIFMKKSDCDKIKVKLINKEDVVMTFKIFQQTGPQYLDGSFDNGIIAHEFGHGISNRLTGGPLVTSCLTNQEQMGEGWSDFFTLVTTVEPGDKGTDQRGIGTYASGEPVSGRGIRRFPYSTDMEISPLTFDDVKGLKSATTGQVLQHSVGEIWTNMLWDMYWKLVDKYGYDPDWRNKNSGNAKALTLVMEGMKIQGCNPGFVRGRNSILKADSLLFGGVNAFDIWDVFSRRGLGYYADGGNPNNIDDGKENFETNPYKIELLKVQKDDITLVKPNDVITIKLNATNHITSIQNGVVVSDIIPQGFSFVAGSSKYPVTQSANKLFFNLGNVPFDKKDTITYKLKATSQKSTSLVKYGFEDGDVEWQIDALKGTNTYQLTDVATKSGESAWYIFAESEESDQAIISPKIKISGNLPALRFWHRFDTELTNDAGFLEISTDGGTSWTVIKDGFIKGGYNTDVAYNTLAVPGLKGFSGTTNGEFIDSYLDMSKWKGQEVNIRFRFVTNTTITSNATFKGWFIDDVELMDLLFFDTQACIANDKSEKGSCSDVRRLIMDTESTVPTIDLPSNISKISLYPNPVSNIINIEVDSKISSEIEIEITQIDGRKILSQTSKLSKGINNSQIEVASFAKGMYLVNIKSEGSIITKKIVVE